MMAYANPPNIQDERQRGDGYGLVRFKKRTRQIKFECWPRFSNAMDGDKGQFPGWPITVKESDNDGRLVFGWLPDLVFEPGLRPVIQVIEDASKQVLYTVRASSNRFQPRVYFDGKYSVKVGLDQPTTLALTASRPRSRTEAGTHTVKLQRS